MAADATQDRLVEVEAVGLAAKAGPAPVGVAKSFRAYDPDQVLLMAPSLADWVPEGHLARFVADLVDEVLDLSEIYASYEEERGFPPYDPRLMVKLMVYGYATGTPSSRKLEERTYSDVAVRFLCANQHPDFRPIARFRKRHLDALAGIFVQSLCLCREAKLVGLGVLALDGTKLRANASRRKAMSYERMVKAERQLEKEIAAIRSNAKALLAEAERVDAQEDQQFGPAHRGDELPEELQRREQRLVRLREAKAALEEQASAREAERRGEIKARGGEPGVTRDGRDPFAVKPTAQRNFTDPQSKIMKTSDGAFHQCFNAQAIVDSDTQIILVADVCDQAPDAQQLEGALEQLQENLQASGEELPEGVALTADAGYFSENNVRITREHGLAPYIATGRFKHSEPQPAAPRGPIPRDASVKQRMARLLATKAGREVYARRKAIVEPVFGQMQTIQDAKRLLLRGEDAARGQWRFNCGVHNLLKLHRNGGLALLNPT